MTKVRNMFLFTAIMLLAVSCTTISLDNAGREAEELMMKMGQGDIQSAIDMSSRPFLFESEILVSETLVSDLWARLDGLDFDQAVIRELRVLSPNDSLVFDDSWEVRTWFENYTDENTAIVFFNWENRELVIVVDRTFSENQRIQAFGEVR